VANIQIRRRLGLVIKFIREKSHFKRRLRKSLRPALNDLDRKLEKYLNFDEGFFIEAGANDGYSQSNTYYLEKRRRWKGILVEGIPELFEKASKQRIQSVVYCCALVSNQFSGATVQMHYANLMSVVEGSLKTRQEQDAQIERGVAKQNLGQSYSVTVPARTLESILEEYSGLPNIDFFSLDVEGYELSVLEGLNLARYRPKYILVEARFFDEVNSFLEKNYYQMIERIGVYDVLYSAI
jgi:FkbM family methyltransferase